MPRQAARTGSSRKTGKPTKKTSADALRMPECGRTFDGSVCRKRGDHFCTQRADHAQALAEEVCEYSCGS
jgi:hypothetical protein